MYKWVAHAIWIEVVGAVDEFAEKALNGAEGVVMLDGAKREESEVQHALNEARRRAARCISGTGVNGGKQELLGCALQETCTQAHEIIQNVRLLNQILSARQVPSQRRYRKQLKFSESDTVYGIVVNYLLYRITEQSTQNTVLQQREIYYFNILERCTYSS